MTVLAWLAVVVAYAVGGLAGVGVLVLAYVLGVIAIGALMLIAAVIDAWRG